MSTGVDWLFEQDADLDLLRGEGAYAVMVLLRKTVLFKIRVLTLS